MIIRCVTALALATMTSASVNSQQCPISGKNDHGTTCISPDLCCSGRCRNTAYGNRACWCLEENKICSYDGECCSYNCQNGRCTSGGFVFPTAPTPPPTTHSYPSPPPSVPIYPTPTPPPPSPPPSGHCPYPFKEHGATCSYSNECCSNQCRRTGDNPGYCHCKADNKLCSYDNECCSYNCNHHTGRCEGGTLPPSPPTAPPTLPPSYECIDKHPYCPYWANSAMYCHDHTHGAFMRANCRHSCNFDSCALNQPTEPPSRPPTPPPSYTCTDNNVHCYYWAHTALYCDDQVHGAFMRANCRLSCNFDECFLPTPPPTPPAPSPPCQNPEPNVCTNRGRPTSLTFEITGGPPLADVGQGDRGGSSGATLPTIGPYTANCAIDDNSIANVNGNILTVSNFGGNDIVCNLSGGGVTQRISFHVSCSQPLFLGQDFGAMNLLTYVDSAGGTECNPILGGNSGGMGMGM